MPRNMPTTFRHSWIPWLHICPKRTYRIPVTVVPRVPLLTSLIPPTHHSPTQTYTVVPP